MYGLALVVKSHLFVLPSLLPSPLLLGLESGAVRVLGYECLAVVDLVLLLLLLLVASTWWSTAGEASLSREQQQ